MSSLEAFLLAKAIEEAERQQQEMREVIELLEKAEIMLGAKCKDLLEAAISTAKQKLTRIEALLQKLRQAHGPAER